MRALHALYIPLLAAALFVSPGSRILADTHAEHNVDATPIDTSMPDCSVDTGVMEPEHGFAQQVIALTNRERIRAGLPALKRQKYLQESAGWMARDMSDHGYFDHRDSGCREMPARLTDFKYGGYHSIGENIAMGQRSPEAVVDCWMNSPGHRANILSSHFSEIGVGYVAPSSHNAYGYWVQDFGSRFETCPIVIDYDVIHTTTSLVKLSIHGQEWVEQMRLSNDGVTWTAWEAFRPLRDWKLEAGCGRRTVYVEIRRAGRVEQLEAEVLVEASCVGSARVTPDTHSR